MSPFIEAEWATPRRVLGGSRWAERGSWRLQEARYTLDIIVIVESITASRHWPIAVLKLSGHRTSGGNVVPVRWGEAEKFQGTPSP